MKPPLYYDQIRALLPHGPLLVLLDKVLVLKPGRYIVCQKNISGGGFLGDAHFPSATIFPGALLAEAIAQAGILLTKLSFPSVPWEDEMVFVIGRTRTRFIRPIIPGDVLIIVVRAIKLYSTQGIIEARVLVEGCIVASAWMTLSVCRRDELSQKQDSETVLLNAMPIDDAAVEQIFRRRSAL